MIHETFEGHSTCGELRYRMTRAPMYVHGCHCTWCQRESGSAFALIAIIESDYLQLLQGEVLLVGTPTRTAAKAS